MVANLGVDRRWARSLTLAVLVGLCVSALAVGVLDLGSAVLRPGSAGTPAFRGGLALIVTGLAGGLTLTGQARGVLARLLPIERESPVHALALTGSVVTLGFLIATQLSTNVLQAENAGGPISVVDLLGQELPLLAAALLGVGLLVRRGGRGALVRLGVVRPKWWHLALALATAGALFAVANGIDYLGQLADPSLTRRVGRTSQTLFGGLDNPAGIAALAIIPAVCEESLFRGALQPRLGIVWVAVLFASFHMQYALSFDTLAVFVLACGLGLVRKYANTTSSMVCHAAYNGLVGIGLTGIWLPAALGIEVVLMGLLGLAWVQRRTGGQGAEPGPL